MPVKLDSITIRSPAKLNLYLEVVGKRPDGYHDLRSVVVPVALFDKLVLARTDGEIQTLVENGKSLTKDSGLVLAADGDNLTTRAAKALKDATGYRGGATILLQKDIPVGGGLGGGSGDAAAVLVGANKLWGTGLTTRELMRIGATLGSDIPALVYGQPVVMEGVGDRVTPIALTEAGRRAAWPVLLVNPGFNVSTKDIYTRYRPSLTPNGGLYTNMVSSVGEGKVDMAVASLFNSLQETVFRKYPLIAIIVEALVDAGALGALLCGSGASVFALVRTEEDGRRIASEVVRRLGMPLWTRVVTTLPDGVMAAHGPLEA